MVEPDEAGTPDGVPALESGPARLSDALETSLAAAGLQLVDQALAGLLRLYARELDGADAMAARARRLARDVTDELGPENALAERVAALEAGLAKRQAVDRIGQRLHAGLVEMLGTPRARAGKRPPGAEPDEDERTDKSQQPPDDADSPLGKLLMFGGGDAG